MTDRLKLSHPSGSATLEGTLRRLMVEDQEARKKELERNIADLKNLLKEQEPTKQANSVSGASRIAARKNSGFKAVSTAPSINKTPRGPTMVPVGYAIVQDLSNSAGVATSVRFNGDAAYVFDQSTQPSCKGDEQGTGGGIRSGTVGGLVRPIESTRTVRTEGKLVVREGDRCTMNNGNTPGVYVTTQIPNQHAPKAAATGSNPPVTLQTKEEESWFSSWLDEVKTELDAAVTDPLRAASGALKDLINLLPELGESLGQAVVEQRAQELEDAALMSELFGREQQCKTLQRVAMETRAAVAPAVALPKFPLTGKAERGGAHVSTLVQLAAGGFGLGKSAIKFLKKAPSPMGNLPRVPAEASNASNDGIKIVIRSNASRPVNRAEIEEWLRREHGITSREKLDDMVDSMDQSKPVRLVELPPGTEVVQYVREGGNVGTFFAYPGTTPAELAISGEGRALSRFVLDRPVSVLEGTAARFPVGKYPGVGGPGGGTQLIFPKNISVPRG